MPPEGISFDIPAPALTGGRFFFLDQYRNYAYVKLLGNHHRPCMLRARFYSYLSVEKQCTPHTCRAYLTDLDGLDQWLTQTRERSLFTPDGAAALSHKDLRHWMQDLIGQGLSYRSVARKLSSAKTYFRFLQRQGQLDRNPAARVKVPRYDKPLPAFLKETEVSRLLDDYPFPADFTGARDRCLLELLYGCGLRRSEVISLRRRDIDRYERSLTVTGKGGKTRRLPYGQHVAAALDAYLGAAQEAGLSLDGPLLVRPDGQALYPKLVYRLVQHYLGAVSSLESRGPHVLRHTYATHLLDRGADLNAIKELLGHSSLAATQVYTHNSISKLKNVHNQAHPRAGNHKDQVR